MALTASLQQARGALIGGSVAGVSLGATAAIVLSVMTPFAIVAALPIVFGGAVGWIALTRFRPIAERTLLGLERALDFLERGGIKPGHELPPGGGGGGLLETIAGEVRKAIAASSEKRRAR